ncbi:MAG: hypothetical protein R3321_02255 [Nitrososphaeraceae archaeon]|nr:hypothetical protein [Nitrososphaeraceae archaeon]
MSDFLDIRHAIVPCLLENVSFPSVPKFSIGQVVILRYSIEDTTTRRYLSPTYSMGVVVGVNWGDPFACCDEVRYQWSYQVAWMIDGGQPFSGQTDYAWESELELCQNDHENSGRL